MQVKLKKTGKVKMQKISKRIYILILLFILAKTAYTQDITIDASLNRNEAEVGEAIILSVVISGKAQNLPDPDILVAKELTISSAGRSQKLTIINGVISSSVNLNYILVPKKEGVYTLGPISVNFAGRNYASQKLQINVHAPRAGAGPYNKPSIPQDNIHKNTKDQDIEEIPKELFIETKVSKRNPYVNEQIILTFAFNQSINLAETPEYKPASTTGFWVEELPPQKRYYKVIAGRRYMVTEIYNALFPTASGDYVISPAELTCTPETVFEDPFSFFYGTSKRKSIILRTAPIKIHARPLPEKDKPADFNGAIGKYTLEAAIDKTNINENNPITLKIIIRGSGNIKTVPDIDLPIEMDSYFKKYKSSSTVNIAKRNYSVQGEKILEFILVPIKSGEIIIPPITFTFFNPETEKYISALTPSFKLNVLPAIVEQIDDHAKENPLHITILKEDIKQVGKDIRYLKSCTNINREEEDYLYQNPIFVTLQIFPLILLGGIIGYKRYVVELEQNVSFARSKKAQKVAINQLSLADKFLKENCSKDFYSELGKTIQNYIGNKINIPHGSVDQNLIKTELFNRGINDAVINELILCLDEIDIGRFAGAQTTQENMHKILNQIKNIIIILESKL